MAHYRQTGKATDKFYDQAAGAGTLSGEKTVGKTVGEHAGMGCFGVETEKVQIVASPCISTACNSVHNPLQDNDLGQVAGAGLEPAALRL